MTAADCVASASRLAHRPVYRDGTSVLTSASSVVVVCEEVNVRTVDLAVLAGHEQHKEQSAQMSPHE